MNDVTTPPQGRVSRSIWARGPKRACDLLLSLIGLVLLSPVLLAAMALVKLTSPGPVFFKQVRTGRNGGEFQPYKLRTMRGGRTPDPDELVPLDHPEITRVGQVLRRLKIDELPQVLNVVKGDMSLIGPRPTLPDQTRAYDEFQRQRLLVRPGVTGLAQVNGNAAISWEQRIKYDVHYVRHHGFWMDIGILLKTVLVLLRGEEKYVRVFEESRYATRRPQRRVAPMNVAFVGSVSSSWHALDALIRGGVEVTGVLGVDESRDEQTSDYRSLREAADAANIPFHSFVKVSEPGVERFLSAHAPDLLWVIGLSQMVPERLIRIARVGGVGFHPTMLPEGRGRAPVAWTILLGARAAANLFFLTDEPDAGDIIVQREVTVLPDDYSEDLIHRTNLVLAETILELAPRIRSGDVPRTPQDHAKATYYEKRTPADGLIGWSATTDQVYRLIRAAGRPYPGAFTHYEGRKLTVWRGKPAEMPLDTEAAEPGRVLTLTDASGVLVATGDGTIWLTDVELEGGGCITDVLQVGARLA